VDPGVGPPSGDAPVSVLPGWCRKGAQQGRQGGKLERGEGGRLGGGHVFLCRRGCTAFPGFP